jgi:hypothetical protein
VGHHNSSSTCCNLTSHGTDLTSITGTGDVPHTGNGNLRAHNTQQGDDYEEASQRGFNNSYYNGKTTEEED